MLKIIDKARQVDREGIGRPPSYLHRDVLTNLQHWQRKRARLAAAGLGGGHDVAAAQDERHRLCLDGRWQPVVPQRVW